MTQSSASWWIHCAVVVALPLVLGATSVDAWAADAAGQSTSDNSASATASNSQSQSDKQSAKKQNKDSDNQNNSGPKNNDRNGAEQSQSEQNDYQLEKVVILSRHGVRPATDTQALEKATARQWPAFLVPDGDLTGHGYADAVLVGQYLAKSFQQQGLNFSKCPDSGAVYALADTDQRDKATAKAVFDGAFPGCGVPEHSMAGDATDPAFHAYKLPFTKLDPSIARQQIEQAMGGSAAQAQAQHQSELNALASAVCRDKSDCPFLHKSWKLKENKHGEFEIKGLDAAASIAETINLEYADNMPLNEVAFGNASNAEMVKKLTALRRLNYQYTDYLPYIAKRGGSELMGIIMASLAKGSAVDASSATGAAPGTKWVFLAGHDTNLAQIRTMLNIDWDLGNWVKNAEPPVGMLLFERYKDAKTGKEFATVRVLLQPMQAIRSLEPMGSKNPPLEKTFAIGSDCRNTSVGHLCSLKSVLAKLNSSIDVTAIEPYNFPTH